MERKWFACGDYTINYDHLVCIEIKECADGSILWLTLSDSRHNSIEIFTGAHAECIALRESILKGESVYIPA